MFLVFHQQIAMWPHYGCRSSVCPSVQLYHAALKANRCRKTKIGVNVHQGGSNQCANFQFMKWRVWVGFVGGWPHNMSPLGWHIFLVYASIHCLLGSWRSIWLSRGSHVLSLDTRWLDTVQTSAIPVHLSGTSNCIIWFIWHVPCAWNSVFGIKKPRGYMLSFLFLLHLTSNFMLMSFVHGICNIVIYLFPHSHTVVCMIMLELCGTSSQFANSAQK